VGPDGDLSVARHVEKEAVSVKMIREERSEARREK